MSQAKPPIYWISDYLTPDDVLNHAVHKVILHKHTQYQEMWIVDCGTYGKGLILDGIWQSSTGDDFLYHEALVQPACVHHGDPKRGLVLGGGEGATIRELLKWKNMERVVMVDLDGEVVEACKEHFPEMHQGAFDDPRVELVIQDAVAYLDASPSQWDVIISDLTDPTEHGPSFKLFTKEYFAKAQRALRPGGCFLLQAGPVSPPSMAMHIRLVSTLRAVFKYAHSYHIHVPMLGHPWGFILASDSPINTRPNPEEVDALLAKNTNGAFKMFDGVTLLGLMNSPKHIREAIAKETTVYTLEHPPVFSTQELPH
ncbi:MAG: methyltransferase domain-containing protein [Chloroflexota bacterium]|nr:methyltransferase domain-containing protein [Chloroflexota bacterium]MBI5702543.1 methyltransferase domain-containing protein [Chloroflexota bacterium]